MKWNHLIQIDSSISNKYYQTGMFISRPVFYRDQHPYVKSVIELAVAATTRLM